MRTGIVHDVSQRKLILGIAGGIGSGKSTVARGMAKLGAFVIDADAIARDALTRPDVIDTLREWWGDSVVDASGAIDRKAVGAIVFAAPDQRERLEGLIHPIVAAERERLMVAAEGDSDVRFIVLDVPLLFEVGLHEACDAVVFVEVDRATRLDRVRKTRGWDAAELDRREKNQWPLDKKAKMSHHILDNSSGEDACFTQVRRLLESFPDHNR